MSYYAQDASNEQQILATIPKELQARYQGVSLLMEMTNGMQGMAKSILRIKEPQKLKKVILGLRAEQDELEKAISTIIAANSKK